jgi:hyaluronoglucosaminidase
VRIRGVIEGFYGKPWSHEERLEMIRFCGREGLNTWVHAPKDDPYHRRQWRDPYPDEELALLEELVGEANAHGVEFVYAIAPGLDVQYSSDAELDALGSKCNQVRGVGIRSFQLLWDDIEHALGHAEDRERYGSAEQPSGAAQCDFSNRVRESLLQPGPLVVCPMGYAGTGDSPYRRSFSTGVHPEIVVYWTGPEVVSIAIVREELDLAVRRFDGHAILLWDNYPVNDFDPARLFLGPLLGRDPRLAEGECIGLVANAMVEAIPSKLALATVADWLGDPRAYDPLVSFERSLRVHGTEVLEELRRRAPKPTPVEARPADVGALVEVLRFGVDAATARTLLEPFV